MQGFSAGGEYAGACTYLVEHCPPDRRARYASLLPAATFVATALVAATANEFAPAAYLTIIAATALGAAALIPETAGQRLSSPHPISTPTGRDEGTRIAEH